MSPVRFWCDRGVVTLVQFDDDVKGTLQLLRLGDAEGFGEAEEFAAKG